MKHKILKRGDYKGNPYIIQRIVCEGKALLNSVVFFEGMFYGGDTFCPFDDKNSLDQSALVVEQGVKTIVEKLLEAKNKTP